MDNQLDSFIEYIAVIEEGNEQFSSEQMKKLELIRTKVSDLLKRSQPPVQPVSAPAVSQTQAVAVPEKIVESFESFVQIDEMIKKRGSKWVVLDKSGKKVLGTHPSKQKALKQLRAIEISKHG